jgi:transposase
MVRRYGVRDAQWDRSKELLPGRAETVGVPAKAPRRCGEAVIYRYRAGMPWRDLPERCGDWQKIHRRHRRWAPSGVWPRVFEHRAGAADNAYAMIDSTLVRAHQHAAGAQGGTGPRQASGAAQAD